MGGAPGGLINLPALVIALLVTWLLMIGTTESARVNAVLVVIKVAALTVFIALTLPSVDTANFNPFLPAGLFGGFGSGVGAVGAAATIFFAYVGFDAVSTAAEETKNPQRNVPIGLIGVAGICTIFYILVAAGAIGTIGGQPIMGPNGIPVPGRFSRNWRVNARCRNMPNCWSARTRRWPMCCAISASARSATRSAVAAFLALPSVILMLLFGQTRIFFVMARDGLLPDVLSQGPSEVEDAAMSSPRSPASSSPSPRPSCRSASLPTSPMPARSSPS